MPSDVLRGIIGGLSTGARTFLAREEQERQREIEEEEREQERIDRELARRLSRARLAASEAQAAERGILLPGVERVPGGPRPAPGAAVPDITEGVNLGDSLVPRGGSRVLAGDDPSTPFDERSIGPVTTPGINPSAPSPQEMMGRDEATVFASRLQDGMRLGRGEQPDVEPGAFDPDLGGFAARPLYRRRRQSPTVGEFLRSGEIVDEPERFQLSGGATYTPTEEADPEAEAFQALLRDVMRARPDLSPAEARLMARNRADVLLAEEEDDLDRTFNVRGREYESVEEAAEAERSFRSRSGIGFPSRGRGSRTPLYEQFGFDSEREYEEFEQRVGDLRNVYGPSQGDPLLQTALQNRARGLSESQVLAKIRADLERSRAQGANVSEADIEQAVRDVRDYFANRAARQIEELGRGRIGGGAIGSGFDLELETPGADTTGAGRRTGGGIGPLRD